MIVKIRDLWRWQSCETYLYYGTTAVDLGYFMLLQQFMICNPVMSRRFIYNINIIIVAEKSYRNSYFWKQRNNLTLVCTCISLPMFYMTTSSKTWNHLVYKSEFLCFIAQDVHDKTHNSKQNGLEVNIYYKVRSLFLCTPPLPYFWVYGLLYASPIRNVSGQIAWNQGYFLNDVSQLAHHSKKPLHIWILDFSLILLAFFRMQVPIFNRFWESDWDWDFHDTQCASVIWYYGK